MNGIFAVNLLGISWTTCCKDRAILVSNMAAAGHLGFLGTKNWHGVGVHDVIIHSKFGFNIFRGFRSTGGSKFLFSNSGRVAVTTTVRPEILAALLPHKLTTPALWYRLY